MGLSLNANTATLGERITLALVVVGFLLEMLSDNLQFQAEPVTVEACVELCDSQGERVHRWEAWACQCNGAAP